MLIRNTDLIIHFKSSSPEEKILDILTNRDHIKIISPSQFLAYQFTAYSKETGEFVKTAAVTFGIARETLSYEDHFEKKNEKLLIMNRLTSEEINININDVERIEFLN
jgi:hypothetical protein